MTYIQKYVYVKSDIKIWIRIVPLITLLTELFKPFYISV